MSMKTTRWSLVLKAGEGSTTEANQALGELYSIYWRPLYAYLRKRGDSPEHASDLIQAFFVHIIETGTIARADPARGKFRSYLLSCLQNFVTNEYARETAKKRRPAGGMFSIDVDMLESRLKPRLGSNETPADAYDRQWALSILQAALADLQSEYAGPKEKEKFNLLSQYLVEAAAPGAYAETARALGMTDGAVKVAVHRLRRQYRQRIRARVRDTVESDQQVDIELADMLRALEGSSA